MRILRPVVIVVAMLLVPLAQGSAQTAGSSLSFGLTGAVNFATLGGDDVSGAESKVGFALGGFLRKTMSDTWAFQGELHYSMKGAQETNNGVTGKLNLNYIEMPLLFRAYAGGASTTRPFIEFGPALALKAGCTLSAESGSTSGSVSCTEFGEIKTFDAGLTGGAGFEFPVGTSKLALGARYTYGLLDIGNGASAQNRNLQIVLGIRF
jgi:hypothetical protein